MPAKDTRTKNQKNDEIDKFNELELQADMLELRKCVQRLENYENDQLFMGSLEDIADAAKQLESANVRKEQKRTKLEKARAIRAAKSTPFDPQAIKDSIAKAEETNRELAVFLSRPTCPPKDPMEYQMMKAKAQRSDELENEKDDDDMLF